MKPAEEIKNMIEPIPNWEFTYRYDGSRTCGKSYIQSLLDEKDKQIKDLQEKVEQLENIRKEAVKLCDEMLSILYHYDDRKVWEDMKDILNKGE